LVYLADNLAKQNAPKTKTIVHFRMNDFLVLKTNKKSQKTNCKNKKDIRFIFSFLAELKKYGLWFNMEHGFIYCI